ncbi:TadE-like protein [Planctomycetes bacterium Pan216]|uniref:TadE-like protein n=1 Tax=Kolteria novifilia TaxID=2527975 RepID=A0A518B2U8_9BACT|nr:TadE-like protein [Planctomycetes bacterium Pan216]
MRRSSLKWQRRGTTVVEVAFVLPVFILLLFGLFEFGRFFNAMNMVNGAAREAARVASTEGGTKAEAEAAIRAQLAPLTNADNLTIYVKDMSAYEDTSSFPDSVSGLPELFTEQVNGESQEKIVDPGQLFVVRVELPFSSVALLTPQFISGNFVLRGQAVMRHEGKNPNGLGTSVLTN